MHLMRKPEQLIRCGCCHHPLVRSPDEFAAVPPFHCVNKHCPQRDVVFNVMAACVGTERPQTDQVMA
jgi:hypothetical protein